MLDIEAAFSGKDEDTDRIDLVFYNTDENERRLMFVEVKRLYDERWGSKSLKDSKKNHYVVDSYEVLEQMKRYRKRLNDEKNNINTQYNEVISYYNNLCGGTLPTIDIDAEPFVGLLLVEYKRSRIDYERIASVRNDLNANGFGVASIGNTTSIDKKNPQKTIQKIYAILKEKYRKTK